MMFVVFCLLFGICRAVFVIRCLLLFGGLLRAVCYVLSGVCSLLVVCYDCPYLFVVCCFFARCP